MTIREHRFKELLSGGEVAKIAGISNSFYSQLENEERRLTLKTAEKLAPVFHMDYKELFLEQHELYKQRILEKGA